MPGNPYEEILDEEQAEASGGASPAPTIYEEILREEDAAQETALRRSFLSTSESNPETVAEARRYSLKFGVPAPIVERNIADYRKRDASDKPFAQMTRETPALTSWLETPENAAVAKDDLEQLGFLEWIVTAPPRAFAQGVNQIRFAQLRARQVRGEDLTRAELDDLDATRYHMRQGGELGATNSWFRGAVTGGANLLAMMFGGAERAAQAATVLGAAGAAGGAGAGAVAGGVGALPGAAAGLSAGAAVGAVYGAMQFGFDLEAGLAYDEFLDLKDRLGQPLDPGAARLGAMAAGAINAGLETVQLGALAKTIPGVARLKGAVTRSAIKQALQSPTVASALADAAKTYTGTLAVEATTEAAQRAVTLLSGELAKITSGQDIERLSGAEIATDVGREFAGAVQAFSLLPVPGVAVSTVRHLQRARQAQENAQLFTVLAEGVTQSKTVQRMPEAAQAFLQQATKDGPLETVYAPVEAWTTYWQSKGLDPAAVAREVTGDARAFEHAQRTGEDLAIPTATYAVKLAPTEHHAFFQQELRLGDPQQWNAREAQAFLADQRAQQDAARLAEEEVPAAPSVAEQIRTVITERLVEAGVMERSTAEANATLLGEFFDVFLGQRAGLDPQAIFAQRGPEVRGVDAPTAVPADAVALEQLPPEFVAVGEEVTANAERAADVAAPGAIVETGRAAVERRDEPLRVMEDIGAAVSRMVAEDPTLLLRMQARDQAAAPVAALVDEKTFFQPPMRALTEDEVAVRDRFLERLERSDAVDAYAAIPETQGGKILSVDSARELSEDYAASNESRRQWAEATHDAASAFIEAQFITRLKDAPAGGSVLLFAGGGGSGKSSVMQGLAQALVEAAAVVRDGVMGDFDSARRRIDLALDADQNVEIAYVHLPFVEAVRRAAERAETMGRPVPLEVLARDHVAAQATLFRLVEHYQEDARVQFRSYDNSGTEAVEATLEDVAAQRYTQEGESLPQAEARLLAEVPNELTERYLRLGDDGGRADPDRGGVPAPDARDPRGPEGQRPPERGGVSAQSRQVPPRTDPDDLAQDARGRIAFGPNGRALIELFQKADLSTFQHEAAHLFLELMGDTVDVLRGRDPATLTAAQQRILTDWQEVVLPHLGVESRTEIGREHHELWARSWEAYLFEGKAPSAALRPIFARFSAWLVGIYRSIRPLNVQLNDDVRAVMDRLIASDAAIEQAQAEAQITPLFATAEMAGMSEAEFAAYRATVQEASDRAKNDLQQQLLREWTRARQAWWLAEREQVRATVAAEIHQQPVYRALAAIRKGTHPDGSPLVEGEDPAPMKLAKAALVNRYAPDLLTALRRRQLYVVEGGLAPDAVAELFGFSSGDELVQALAAAPLMAAVIDAETDARMSATHGDSLIDGSLVAKAEQAVYGEHREVVVRAELRALAQARRQAEPAVRVARQAGRAAVAAARQQKQGEIDALRDELGGLKAQARGGAARIRAMLPPDDVLRQAARERIAHTRVRDLQPSVFLAAAQRASQTATEAAARQLLDEAGQAKQQELFNLALYRAARAAQEAADAQREFLQSFLRDPARQRMAAAAADYLDQIDGFLERYEFQRVTNRALARRASLRTWVASLQEQGLPIELPDEVIDDARRINWRELTVDELTGVHDAVRHIAHLARVKNTLLTAAAERDFDGVRNGLVASIRAHNTTRPVPLEFRPSDDRKRSIGDWFASHRKIASLARTLDGGHDGGAVLDAIIRPLNAAADTELVRKQEAGRRYAAILEKHYPGRELATLDEKAYIPAIDASLSKEGRLAVALNWGNEDNRERLLNDPRRRWSRASIEAIFNTLDARDWAFVQETWDFIDEFWEEIKAKQARVSGIVPEKVQAAPFVTRFGQQLRGGYHPLAYDGRLTIRGQQHEAATEAKGLLAAAYVASTTKRGHLEARQQNVKLSVRLDLGVVFGHIEQVLHDLTHHEAVLDVARLLRDPAVAEAILDTRGDQVYQQFTRALQDIAVGTRPAQNILDRAATFMRTRTQLAMLGWNFWTAAQQPLGLFNGAERVGVRWVMRGMVRWLRDAASMESTAAWIAEVSPMMRGRGLTATQDLNDLRNALRRPGGWFDALLRATTWDRVTKETFLDSYLWHIGMMQRVADIPTWLGQYEKSLAAGESEARAIALADQAVIDSQGSGQMKDLAQIQRGSPVAKLFLMFYSYGNTVFNSSANAFERTDVRSPVSVARLLGSLSLLYIGPAFGTVVMARLLGKTLGRDDDEEDGVAGFLADVGRETVSTALNTIVLVREFGGLVGEETRGYAGPAGTRLLQLAYRLATQIKQGELDEALWRAANATAGTLFGFPAAQVQRTIDGWIALEEGRTKNPAALLVGPPRGAR